MLPAITPLQTLEAPSTAALKVAESTRDGVTYLTISGFSMHSALAVDHIEIIEGFDTLTVRVRIGFVGDNKQRGDFSYEVPVPRHVQKVLFGDQHAVTCQRSDT
jgi:hypothetical protein